MLWGRDSQQIESMAGTRCNARYLPEVRFPDSLAVTADFKAAVSAADDILLVVPSHSFRSTLIAIGDALGEKSGKPERELRGISWATKGFELETGKLPHEVAAEVVAAGLSTAVLSGPTFASEVGAGLPSAMTIASSTGEYARQLAEMMSTETFRAYTSDDIVGVEVGGATKNVFAIGAGISDGLGFGANTRVAMLTRGLAEMTRLGTALGARQETFMGLAGIGDLVLTCTDDQSRNRRFGLALARGASVDEARQSIGQVVEGYYSARSVRTVARRLGVDMPIVDQIYRVLYEQLDVKDAVSALMSRPIMRES